MKRLIAGAILGLTLALGAAGMATAVTEHCPDHNGHPGKVEGGNLHDIKPAAGTLVCVKGSTEATGIIEADGNTTLFDMLDNGHDVSYYVIYEEASPSETPSPEPTPTPTASPTPSPTPSSQPSPTPSPTATPSPTPEPTNTPSPSATPTPTPSSTPTASPAATPTSSPSTAPSVTPTLPPTDTEETNSERAEATLDIMFVGMVLLFVTWLVLFIGANIDEHKHRYDR
jgi:hypothetical protein